ncbi:MAG: indole-3-glycerol-phosphate synthase [Anaerolineales bacterium]|nr:indole-3-glycerol-phosphate synthase [Anaerolineales bacterium]MCB8991053.1 indole-3-glycerol-phosphate synthase [Ardenticatenaceae bacterium]MCB9004095.1 indole-3-glycerol-phosphate synthase [Ardenticatenaceae bacterium]
MSVTNLAKRRGKILDDMMRFHRGNLPKRMAEIPLEDLRAFASLTPPATDLAALLRQPGTTLIASCQKASPVRGLLANHYNAVRRAQEFVKAGATAVAIHTDARHYQGQLEDLRDARETLPRQVPLIHRDFIFDPYQVYESRVAGADGIWLITAVLGESDLRALIKLTQKLGMIPLVDVHTEEELGLATAVNAPVIVLNRRNWQTFAIHEDRVAELRPHVPETTLVIAAGGYDTANAIREARPHNLHGILIGEALARSKTPDLLLREMVKANHLP